MSEIFESLQQILWKQFNECIDDKNSTHTECRLHSLIGYTKQYQINIKFGGLIVTRKNTSIFMVGFVASRMAAYAIGMLY